MKLITSHIGSDFDSLASMVAVRHLYPDGVLCFSGSSERNVRDFLKRHRDQWSILTPRKVNLEEVTQLIVVDTRSRRRLGVLAPLLDKPGMDVHLYDHHPPCSDDIEASVKKIEPLGATVTLLLEEMLKKGIIPAPVEATLFAIAIYEDTGGLIFGGTTDRDYSMMCKLRKWGADLTLIPTAIEMNLSVQERKMMDRLVENAWERYISGARVILTMASVDNYIEGLSLFIHRLREFFEADIVIAAVRMSDKTYIVGRSRGKILDVASLLRPLGGGGHAQAASASVSARKPGPLLKELEAQLENMISPVLTVNDVMTSPVMAVDEESLVNVVYRTMLRYGHSALPVTRAGSLVGLITRKDLDKAQLHGYGSAQVMEFMTEGVISVSSGTSITEVHRKMVNYNIGRLPVVENNSLKGIVTRTDLLRALYPASMLDKERQAGSSDYPWMEFIPSRFDEGLSPPDRGLLKNLGRRASQLGMSAYVVGGAVRDILLGRSVNDLDLVLEGDAAIFIRSWEKDGCEVSIHGRFKTGTIVYPGGRKVDVATARREFYEFPSAKPTVSSDSLKHDLYRRDFTVNSMAIAIDGTRWGMLMDYFGGRRDVMSKKLRTLHNLSFVEDSTRIFRGIRLEQRLGFDLDDNVLKMIRSCLKGGLVSGLSGFRLRTELEISLMESRPWPVILRMDELNIWEEIFPGIKLGPRVSRALRRVTVFRKRLEKDLPVFDENLWLASLASLLLDSPKDVWLKVVDRLNLSPKERKITLSCLDGIGVVEDELGGRGDKSFSDIYFRLNEVSNVVILFWAVATSRWRFRRRVLLYLTRLLKVRSMLTGGDLTDIGYDEGPVIGEMLQKLLKARLDGKVDTREDELLWISTRYPQKL